MDGFIKDHLDRYREGLPKIVRHRINWLNNDYVSTIFFGAT